MARVEVAQGVWCADCEYFEVPDWDGEVTIAEDLLQVSCMACGCGGDRHQIAAVIVEEGQPCAD